MVLLHAFLALCALRNVAQASVTVYGQTPIGDVTSTGAASASASAASYTGAAAYDPTVLNPPAIPNPGPATQYTIQLQSSASSVTGLSIPQGGHFMGFSIEFSVINQVLGKNSSFLQVPFLNLMSNIVERGGEVRVRLGGNTQDFAWMVDSLSDGKILEKDLNGVSNPTQTPPLVFTPDVMYMMRNISALTNVRWYLGIPFNDTNWRLQIAEYGESILGDYLLGLQAGNEPDLYSHHGHRNSSYGPYDYFGEFGSLVQTIAADNQIPVRNNLIAPSVANAFWTPENVFDTGFVAAYTDQLNAIAVEHYPTDNCFAQFGIGSYNDPQAVFPEFLNHTEAQILVQPYLNASAFSLANNKPFIMFETNTASCGGFPGISDSFGSALWALDYSLQMAYSNFSNALFHVGGQNVYYNPFTPPPTNQSTFHEWTIGPIYYANLIVAEAFGSSNKSQLIDLFANNASIYTPAYAIYDSGNLARVAIFNYITDPSGASDSQVTLSLTTAPSSVKVKYLEAPSVSSKDNVTWAGQTFGSNFQSDGRLRGDLNITTINCDTTANTCIIPVKAPSFALVFLSDDALNSSGGTTAAATFPTSAHTKTINTATIDAGALATSNGMNGKMRHLGSTSKGSSGATTGSQPAWLLKLLAGVFMLWSFVHNAASL